MSVSVIYCSMKGNDHPSFENELPPALAGWMMDIIFIRL